jgi:hypothetical protein
MKKYITHIDTNTNTTECVMNTEKGCSCMSEKTMELVESFAEKFGPDLFDTKLEQKNLPENNAIRTAAKITGCNSELCILESEKFKKYSRKYIKEIRNEIRDRFKTIGPRDSRSLLSNVNIDSVIRQWKIEFPKFHPIEFAMSDFYEYPSELVMTNVGKEIIDTNHDCAGLALNTDIHSRGGKHWVGFFMDFRDDELWRLIYFNSSGNPPFKSITRFMEELKTELSLGYNKKVESVVLSRHRHQPESDNSECGLYVLFFIRKMLERTSDEFFIKNTISTKMMQEFRKHVFREKTQFET